MIITSLITVFALGASDVQNTPPSLGVYEHKYSIESQTNVDLPSVVRWKEMSIKIGLTLPTARKVAAVSSPEILHAFGKIGLPESDGLVLLNKAKEILEQSNFPCANVVPILANDLEEETSYLTLRLYVNASMQEALELDTALTHGLISSFPRLPVSLSFSVYEIEKASV